MFNHFLTRLAVLGQMFLLGARSRVTAHARGANFIEYALLAVIAVIIFALFRSQLAGVFSGVFDRVRDALGTSDSGAGL